MNPTQTPADNNDASPLTTDTVMSALDGVFDPEFGISIVDLGLVYAVEVTDATLGVEMTLTTPACPASEIICDGVRRALETVAVGRAVDVRLVWIPPWSPKLMSELAREQLGW